MSREELLSRVGEPQASLYNLVRGTLDEMDRAAPWDDLYSPPADARELLEKTSRLLTVIEAIPGRVGELSEKIRQSAEAENESLVGDMEFFFHGIHTSVEHDLSKLGKLLSSFAAEGEGLKLSDEDRAYTCELCADLKGKYASSIMGASASLIAEGRWNGVEIEPVLYPEKAQEFERNQRLVATLSEVTENINNLLEEVPLAELVETWQAGERVDQYSLTALYSLLGNLGKLMQEASRRALYSGDYHQIQRRETLLSARVNELTTLHNMTWHAVPTGAPMDSTAMFSVMVRKATELAAILNVDILRRIIGAGRVEDLLTVVTQEKESNPTYKQWVVGSKAEKIEPSPARDRIPEELRSLIPLLYDEDLNTFLELLLGSVLKRASLTVVVPEVENLAASEVVPPAAEQAAMDAGDSAQAVISGFAAELAAEIGEAPPPAAQPAATAPDSVAPVGGFDESELPQFESEAAQVDPGPGLIDPLGSEAADPESMVAPFEPAEPLLDLPDFSSEFGDDLFDLPAPELSSEPVLAEAPSSAASLAAPEPAQPSFEQPSFEQPSFEQQGIGHSNEEQAGVEAVTSGRRPKEALVSLDDIDVPEIDEQPSASFEDSPWSTDGGMPAELESLPMPEVEDWQGAAAGSGASAAKDASSGADEAQQQALEKLNGILARLLSRSDSKRKSFELIHRLLKQQRQLPAAMYQSMHPYLFELMNTLIPELNSAELAGTPFASHGEELIGHCQALCIPSPSAGDLAEEIPRRMDQVSDLLSGLNQKITETLASVS